MSQRANPAVDDPAALDAAVEIMRSFAERTGLSAENEPRRYLWTDAFAVINFLELYRRTNEERYGQLAADLIRQVHWSLGRHRAEDATGAGWLSGLDDEQASVHPTAGGLRIGKPLPERKANEPYDDRLEWDRDGQYFHYLTRWMEALARAGTMLRESSYQRWAVELAKAVFPCFLQRSPRGDPLGLAWKMSIDLSRPQVSATSAHDALDGYVTFRTIGHTSTGERALAAEIEVLDSLVGGHDWVTSDPLGLGGLLLDALRLTFLSNRSQGEDRLITRILEGVIVGLNAFLRQDALRHPPASRLAFRELGLAIGLQGLDHIEAGADLSPVLGREMKASLAHLRGGVMLGEDITRFWTAHGNQRAASWHEHRDINEVMLATALLKAQVRTTRSSATRKPDEKS